MALAVDFSEHLTFLAQQNQTRPVKRLQENLQTLQALLEKRQFEERHFEDIKAFLFQEMGRIKTYHEGNAREENDSISPFIFSKHWQYANALMLMIFLFYLCLLTIFSVCVLFLLIIAVAPTLLIAVSGFLFLMLPVILCAGMSIHLKADSYSKTNEILEGIAKDTQAICFLREEVYVQIDESMLDAGYSGSKGLDGQRLYEPSIDILITLEQQNHISSIEGGMNYRACCKKPGCEEEIFVSLTVCYTSDAVYNPSKQNNVLYVPYEPGKTFSDEQLKYWNENSFDQKEAVSVLHRFPLHPLVKHRDSLYRHLQELSPALNPRQHPQEETLTFSCVNSL